MFRYLVALLTAAAALPAFADTASGIVVGLTPERVIANLAADCVRRNQQIDTMTTSMLVCSQRGNVLAQILLSPRYADAPVLRLRFIALPQGDDTLLQLSQNIEVVNAYGGVRTTDMRIRDFSKVIESANGGKASQSSGPQLRDSGPLIVPAPPKP